MITRRAFGTQLAVGVFTVICPNASLAQRPVKLKRVGILAPRLKPQAVESDITYGAFVQRMRELGWTDSRSIVLDWRFAEGKYERLPGLARELVAAQVDVIVAMTPPSVQAAKAATSAIPIVMVAVGDPVSLGFVSSFSRPGGNVTGVSNAIDDVSRKYLELLREAVPNLASVVALVNPDNPNARHIFGQVQAAGRAIGVTVVAAEANSADRIRQAFAGMRAARPDAIVVQGDGFFFVQRELLAELALGHRIATMFWTQEPVRAGGLMSYGQNVADDYRKAAGYVDRILRGARPEDLPIDQPTEVKLAINVRTAKALGLQIPHRLLLRADEVID